jgi:hypothetical protein
MHLYRAEAAAHLRAFPGIRLHVFGDEWAADQLRPAVQRGSEIAGGNDVQSQPDAQRAFKLRG